MAILEVKDLKKSFGDAEVLKGISFSLEEKNVLAIIGSSGSGKNNSAALHQYARNCGQRLDNR